VYEKIKNLVEERKKKKIQNVLQFIQRNKFVITVVLILFIISFLVIGLFSYVSNTSNKNVVAKVDGKTLKIDPDLTNLKRKIDAFSKL
jgi:hypothetical protein